MSEVKIDVVKMVDQIMETKINNEILEAAEAVDDGTAVAFIKLLNEYDIYGSRALSFIKKVDLIQQIIHPENPEEE